MFLAGKAAGPSVPLDASGIEEFRVALGAKLAPAGSMMARAVGN
jgi:hypothetical protein